jgi:hypothetical protein
MRGTIPWLEAPHSLVSWWDVEKFSADVYFTIGRALAEVKSKLEKSSKSPDQLIEPGIHQTGDANALLILIKSSSTKIGLNTSARCVDYILQLDAGGMKVGELLELFEQLKRTITWEMQEKLFMFMPPDRARRYDQKELLGKTVNAKFPSVQYDATEAGNCYACGRSTAAVFHLMRIMEVGVQEFGAKLGIPLASEKVWQVILDGIDKAIKKMPPKDQLTVTYSQIAANLYSVKLAWRNEVMHPKETYTLEEADNLIRQTMIFMEQLAAII